MSELFIAGWNNMIKNEKRKMKKWRKEEKGKRGKKENKEENQTVNQIHTHSNDAY